MEEQQPTKKTRIDLINEYLEKYPIEQHLEWYKLNLPDVFAGYVHARKTSQVTVKQKAKSSLKTLLILLGILGVFSIIVFAVITYFASQGLSMFK